MGYPRALAIVPLVIPFLVSQVSSQTTGGLRTVHGIVTDECGNPRAGVRIGPDFDTYLEAPVSDVDGRFELAVVPPDRKHWVAFPGATGMCGLFVIPPDAKQVHVTLQFGTGSLEGKIVDPKGRGLEGAEIHISARHEGELFLLTREKSRDGGYFQSWIPAGGGLTLLIEVVKDGATMARADPLELRDGQKVIELPDLTVPSAEGLAISDKETRKRLSGVVRSEDGHPIAGADVEIRWDLAMGGTSSRAQTGSDGRWSRRVPIEVNDASLRIEHPRYVSTVFERAFPSPPMEKLLEGSAVSVLKRGHVVTGRVRDGDGNPVGDALIVTQPLYSWGGAGSWPHEDGTMTRTGVDGRFSIDGIPAGSRALVVYGRGFAPGIAPAEVGADMVPVEVTLQTGAQMTGRVVDQDNKPVEGATVAVSRWQSSGSGQWLVPATDKSDADGRFTLAHLPSEGSIELSYWKKGYSHVHLPAVGLQDGPQRLVLRKPGTIAGRIIEESTGEPVSRFELIAGWRDDQKGPIFSSDRRWKIDAMDGKFSKTSDMAGGSKLPLRVIADGYVVTDIFLNTKDGSPPADIRLVRGEPMTGRVLAPSGEPLAGAQVAWVGPDRQAFPTKGRLADRYAYRAEIVVTTDEAGRFRLPRTRQKGHVFVTAGEGYALIPGETFEDVIGGGATGAASAGGQYVSLIPPDRSSFGEFGPVQRRTPVCEKHNDGTPPKTVTHRIFGVPLRTPILLTPKAPAVRRGG